MNDTNDAPRKESRGIGDFFASLLGSIVRDIVKLVVIFALGTAGGAIFCFYNGYPLAYSVFGGIAIFAIAVAAFLSS